MYIAAGQIIPAVTGKTWEDYIREKILLPLGMTTTTNTQPTPPSNRATTTLSLPHSKVDGQLQPIEFVNLDNDRAVRLHQLFRRRNWPSGSRCNSTAENFHTGNERLFTEAQSREMWSAQTILPAGPSPRVRLRH